MNIPISFSRLAGYNPRRIYLAGITACMLGGWGHFLYPSLLWQLIAWLGFTCIIGCDAQTGRRAGMFLWGPVALVLNFSPMMLVLNTKLLSISSIYEEYGHIIGIGAISAFSLGLVAAVLGYLLGMGLSFRGSALFNYGISFGIALELFDRLGLPARLFSSELHSSMLGWHLLPFGLGLSYLAFFLLFSSVIYIRFGWLSLLLWFVPAQGNIPNQPLPIVTIQSVNDWLPETTQAIFVCGQGSLPKRLQSAELKRLKERASDTGTILVLEGEFKMTSGDAVLIITPEGAVVQPSYPGEGYIHATSWMEALQQVIGEFRTPSQTPAKPIKGFSGKVQLIFCYQNSQSWRFDRERPQLVLNLGDLTLFDPVKVKVWQREQLTRIQAQTHAQVVSANLNGPSLP